jgi:predicted RNA-binding protein with PIN domain
LTVVFDGKGGKGRLYQYEGIKNYTVIYSSSVQGADGVIEKMLIASKFPERISVATNDGLIRNCAFQTGASTIRIEELLKKLDGAINRTKIRLNPQKTNHQEGPLQNRLNIPDIN